MKGIKASPAQRGGLLNVDLLLRRFTTERLTLHGDVRRAGGGGGGGGGV